MEREAVVDRSGASAQFHMPLTRSALCLDCSAVFPIQTSCPGCGSKAWALLATWMNRGNGELQERAA